ncbi:MAG: UvrD-helicase domain-containing protein [bacterium]
MTLPVDHRARVEALDSSHSVIIQAPAGSGKTGLLVRRFLRLLAEVEEPEQILGITFTRKATTEMRKRIIDVLQWSGKIGESDNDSELQKLSGAALANDQKRGWNLVTNTRRLRIQTIDSLCNELVQRMPWSARFGAPPLIIEDAEALYREAARRTLGHLESHDDAKLSNACKLLMDLLDANLGAGIELLTGMLKKRDKWMRLLGGHSRAQLESWWKKTIDDTLIHCNSFFSDDLRSQLLELAPFAAKHISEYNQEKNKPASKLEGCIGMQQFPEPTHTALAYWQGLADLVLLGSRKGIRKTVNVQSGFPPSQPEIKGRMVELLDSLRENVQLQKSLIWVSELPEPRYSNEQWQSLDAILELLPVAAAELKLLFSEPNQADYIELAQRAELALGDESAPTDLALIFDYQLKHVLVDEFQDTSAGQISLLEKLLEGWQPGDGRTAFFVGDPMQSIYRFREAEVANFLHTQSHGIGDVVPVPLLLNSNFRSDAVIVEWVNNVFTEIMPDQSDEIRGAVRYAKADPFLGAKPGCEVQIHPGIDRSAETEAAEVAELIIAQTNRFPNESIAVLGRTRSSLTEIARTLESYGISYQGIKLQKLGERQAIQDLLNLACAIQQPSDRVAWLGLMRAPWCGLDLNDMVQICGHDKALPIMTSWGKSESLQSLSAHSQSNLQKLRNEMARSLSRRGVVPLWKNLEATWVALGGPACVAPTELDDCQRLIGLVRQLEADGIMINRNSLDLAIRELWANADNPCSLQLLTIHAAKGLEFDTVVLPGLERQTRSNDPDLLRFHNLPDRLLLAPKPSSQKRDDPFYSYLGQLEKEHLHNESSRLLYVACTRARQRLHLFGKVNSNPKGEFRQPPPSSLLSLLWPVVKEKFEHANSTNQVHLEPDHELELSPECNIERLPSEWRAPTLPDPVQVKVRELESDSDSDVGIEFDWAGEITRISGIVIHRILQHIEQAGWHNWCNQPINDQIKQRWRVGLIRAGISVDELDLALRLVEDAVAGARTDPTAAWIFSPKHQDVRTEWPITGFVRRKICHCVIDRSFIDEDGTRWVIDFKSSRHEQEQDLEQFMHHERERYRNTMEQYSSLIKALDERPVRKALYYPVLQRFEEL